jgi:nitrite reductase (NO-forming)
MRKQHFSGTLRALLLGTLTAITVVTASAASAAESGEKVFMTNCAACHQAQAQGMAGLAPPLKNSHWSKYAGIRSYVPGVLLAGMNGSLAMESGNFVGVMPPQNRLSDDEIAAVTNYLFAEVNQVAGWKSITAAEVATLRKNTPAVSALKALRKTALGK